MCESSFANCPREAFFGLGSRRHIGPQKQKDGPALGVAALAPVIGSTVKVRVLSGGVSCRSPRGRRRSGPVALALSGTSPARTCEPKGCRPPVVGPGCRALSCKGGYRAARSLYRNGHAPWPRQGSVGALGGSRLNLRGEARSGRHDALNYLPSRSASPAAATGASFARANLRDRRAEVGHTGRACLMVPDTSLRRSAR